MNGSLGSVGVATVSHQDGRPVRAGYGEDPKSSLVDRQALAPRVPPSTVLHPDSDDLLQTPGSEGIVFCAGASSAAPSHPHAYSGNGHHVRSTVRSSDGRFHRTHVTRPTQRQSPICHGQRAPPALRQRPCVQGIGRATNSGCACPIASSWYSKTNLEPGEPLVIHPIFLRLGLASGYRRGTQDRARRIM